MAGMDATLHQTIVASSPEEAPVTQERPIPPRAMDHENSGGRGLIEPIGYALSASKM